MLKKINKNVYLDETEINILHKYNISYEAAQSYDEILLLIDNAANDDLTD